MINFAHFLIEKHLLFHFWRRRELILPIWFTAGDKTPDTFRSILEVCALSRLFIVVKLVTILFLCFRVVLVFSPLNGLLLHCHLAIPLFNVWQPHGCSAINTGPLRCISVTTIIEVGNGIFILTLGVCCILESIVRVFKLFFNFLHGLSNIVFQSWCYAWA